MFYYWVFRLEEVVEPFIENLWPSLEKVFDPSQSKIEPDEVSKSEFIDSSLLSDVVKVKLELGPVSIDTGSGDYTEFEKALRGSDDHSWRSQLFTSPPSPPAYLNVQLHEVFSYLPSH